MSSRSVTSYDDYYFKSPQSDEYYDTRASDEEYSSEEQTTVEHEATTAVTFARYEVTENIVDVPDTSSVPGPALANFTLKPPLNIGQPNKTNTASSTDNNDRGNLKKNYISILHINAEYDHPQTNTPQNTDEHTPNIPFFPGIRHFIRGLRKGIAQSIHGLVNRDHNDFNQEENRPNLVPAPLVFINKFHRKSPSANSREHKVIFGQSSEEDY